jgi:hypothetical protein
MINQPYTKNQRSKITTITNNGHAAYSISLNMDWNMRKFIALMTASMSWPAAIASVASCIAL